MCFTRLCNSHDPILFIITGLNGFFHASHATLERSHKKRSRLSKLAFNKTITATGQNQEESGDSFFDMKKIQKTNKNEVRAIIYQEVSSQPANIKRVLDRE
jgi:hypothetical protein